MRGCLYLRALDEESLGTHALIYLSNFTADGNYDMMGKKLTNVADGPAQMMLLQKSNLIKLVVVI